MIIVSHCLYVINLVDDYQYQICHHYDPPLQVVVTVFLQYSIRPFLFGRPLGVYYLVLGFH